MSKPPHTSGQTNWTWCVRCAHCQGRPRHERVRGGGVLLGSGFAGSQSSHAAPRTTVRRIRTQRTSQDRTHAEHHVGLSTVPNLEKPPLGGEGGQPSELKLKKYQSGWTVNPEVFRCQPQRTHLNSRGDQSGRANNMPGSGKTRWTEPP